MVEKFEPHVVLLDLFMPGVDGFELCKKLKSDPGTQEIRVIAISGRLNPTAVERITELGAEACLEKPVDRAELFRVIGLRDSATDQAENHL